MREIKFKAFDNIDKKMYPYAIPGFNGELHVHKNAEHNGEWINIGCGREDGEVDYSNELLQYLGLKDKNGKEICEGDIVRVYTKGTEFTFIEEIVFENYSFCSKREYLGTDKKIKYSLSSIMPENFDYEILWNRYENPELLTK